MGLFDNKGKSKEKKCYEEDIPEWVTKLYSDKKSVGIGAKIKNLFSEDNNDKKVKQLDGVSRWTRERISSQSTADISLGLSLSSSIKIAKSINIDNNKSTTKEEISSNEVPNWVKNKLS